VSLTTRHPRPGEVAGLHYLFCDDRAFDGAIEAGELLEWAEFAGHRYGTPRAPVLERLDRGEPVLLEIELEGARQVRRAMPEALLVFLAPPSWDVLARRLSGRGTEDELVIAQRLARARVELDAAAEFDVTVVNHDVHDVCQRLVALVEGADDPTQDPAPGSTPGRVPGPTTTDQ
jgi:guanylate kinase